MVNRRLKCHKTTTKKHHHHHHHPYIGVFQLWNVVWYLWSIFEWKLNGIVCICIQHMVRLPLDKGYTLCLCRITALKTVEKLGEIFHTSPQQQLQRKWNKTIEEFPMSDLCRMIKSNTSFCAWLNARVRCYFRDSNALKDIFCFFSFQSHRFLFCAPVHPLDPSISCSFSSPLFLSFFALVQQGFRVEKAFHWYSNFLTYIRGINPLFDEDITRGNYDSYFWSTDGWMVEFCGKGNRELNLLSWNSWI